MIISFKESIIFDDYDVYLKAKNGQNKKKILISKPGDYMVDNDSKLVLIIKSKKINAKYWIKQFFLTLLLSPIYVLVSELYSPRCEYKTLKINNETDFSISIDNLQTISMLDHQNHEVHYTESKFVNRIIYYIYLIISVFWCIFVIYLFELLFF